MRRIPYAEMARRKASPGGWCSAQRIRICMTAGGSHTATTLAQRQLRLMRSKQPMIAISWYDAVTFDLIRHAIRRDTFPSRGRLFSVPAGFCIEFAAQALQPGGRGMPPPLQCLAGSLHPKSPPFRLDNLPLAGYYIGCAGFGPKQRDSIVILHKKGAFTHVLSHDCCRSGAGPSHLPGE